MNKQQLNKVRKTFCLQQDETDCGVACLRSICRYHGANHTMEMLRQLCGCGLEGTSMLGLHEAALRLNFRAEGYELTMSDLCRAVHPVILHVSINQCPHYIICYGRIVRKNETLFIIGDPAKGIIFLTAEELQDIWLSQTALFLEPRGSFYQSIHDTKKEKRKWIVTILQSHFPILTITGVMGIIIAALGLTVSIFSQQLIDRLLPAHKLTEVCVGIISVTTLLLMREILTLVRNRLILFEGKKIHFGIAGDFFSKMLHLPYSFFDGRSIGDLTSRLHDTASIQRVIMQIFGNVFIDLLVVIASYVMIFFYSPVIAIGCLVFSPIYFWIVLQGQKPMRSAQQKMFEANAGNESVMVDILKGVHAVRQNSRQLWFADRYNKQLESYLDSIVNLGYKQSNVLFRANIAGTILIGAIIAAGAFKVFDESLKTGQFIAILSIAANLLPSIGNLASSIFPVSEGIIAFNRLFECKELSNARKNDLKEEETSNHVKQNTIEKIEFEAVSFRFTGRPAILRGVDFQFSKGCTVGLTGTNGCGKTSLATMLMKDHHPNQGRIVINGETDIDQVNNERWRKLVSIVPQQIHLFNGTVLENIAFEDARSRKPFVMEFLKKIGLSHVISMLPNGGNTIIGEKGVRLSGGQQQVIGWARALYRNPQLLILDEAFSNLDENATEFFLELLQSGKREMMILVITHQQEVLGVCDEVFELKDGRMEIVKKVVCNKLSHRDDLILPTK
jgi:ATP-binding cassette, subfamily C, bacteriocin exporter